MFATDGTERDPVAVYNFCFVRKRPEEMNQDDSFFNLVPGGKKHFKGRLGRKKRLVEVRYCQVGVQKAGLRIENHRLPTHSGGKTMIQTLSKHDIPPTQIAQLSDHKSLKSIKKTKTKVSSSEVAGTSVSSSSQSTCPSSSDAEHIGKQSVKLFSGAVIRGGSFSIHTNTVNQSPTLGANASSPVVVRWKGLKRLELESESGDN